MNQTHRWIAGSLLVVLLVTALGFVAVGRRSAPPAEESPPVKVERLEGLEPTRVTLTQDAANRLDIQTATVRELTIDQAPRQAIPYAAIVYDTQGNTWTYTSLDALTFVRHPVAVDRIQEDLAIMSDALPSGTAVVTVGAEE